MWRIQRSFGCPHVGESNRVSGKVRQTSVPILRFHVNRISIDCISTVAKLCRMTANLSVETKVLSCSVHTRVA